MFGSWLSYRRRYSSIFYERFKGLIEFSTNNIRANWKSLETVNCGILIANETDATKRESGVTYKPV